LATSFGLGRPSSGLNIYTKVNASLQNVLFVNVMGSHLKLYIFFIINACSSCVVYGKYDKYILTIYEKYVILTIDKTITAGITYKELYDFKWDPITMTKNTFYKMAFQFL
jgi:hypothetical protein